MYPKNAASPPRIAIGPVVQISDGAVQTSGCTVRVLAEGAAEADGGGTTSYSTDGVVCYVPTQAETNYTAFVLIAKKTGCIPATVTVVTTASATAGKVVLSGETHTSAVVPTVTTVTNQLTAAQIATGVWQDATAGDFTAASSIGKCLYIANVAPGAAGGHFIAGTNAATSITTALTANITGNLSGSVGSVTGAVGSVTGAVGSVTGAVGSVTAGVTIADSTSDAVIADAVWNALTASYGSVNTYGALIESGNVGGGAIVAASVTGAVGSVTGAVGSVTGNVGGNVTGSVGSVATGGIAAASFAAGAINAAAIAADAIGASELAADAVSEIAAAITIPTAAAVADAVWDEALSGHTSAGTAGLALSTASSGGVDPSVLADAIWDEALSGHATAGTAGKKLTDLANADLSGVATAANLAIVDTVVDGIATTLGVAGAGLTAVTQYIDTEVSTIVSQTSASAIRSAVGLASANLDTQIGTLATASALATVDSIIDNIHDTDLPAVKADTAALTGIPVDKMDRAIGKLSQTWSIANGVGTFKKASGATFTETQTSDAAGEPITGSTPT